jgi:hypothetical protein
MIIFIIIAIIPRGVSSPCRPAWRLLPLTTHPRVILFCLYAAIICGYYMHLESSSSSTYCLPSSYAYHNRRPGATCRPAAKTTGFRRASCRRAILLSGCGQPSSWHGG